MIEGVWFDILLVVCLLALFLAAREPSSGSSMTGREKATRAWQQVAERPQHALQRLGRQAGYDPGLWRDDYLLVKLAGGVLPPLLLLDAGARGWLAGLAAFIGFFLPDFWLILRRRRRRRIIARALPYFLDLLVAFLHSGLGLVEAFRRAGREAFPGPHPLAQEVALVGRELDAGRDPSSAFRDLAERTGVIELNAVAAALRVGMRLGAPIRETLLAQADALLVKRREDAMSRIHRAELQMMFPVMLSGFPVLAVLMFFPMIMELAEAYRRLTGVMLQ